MQLRRLQLKNISHFSALNIDFQHPDDKFAATVILGDQNSGKTTLLKNIFHGLSWFACRHKDIRASGISMTDLDIMRDKRTASLLLEVNYPQKLGILGDDSHAKAEVGEKCHWKVSKTRQNTSAISVSTSDLSTLDQLIQRYHKHAEQDPLLSIPCIAYYPVERFIYEMNIHGKNIATTLSPLHHAYDLTVVNFTTFSKFFEWFREAHDLENAQSAQLMRHYLDPQIRFNLKKHFDDTLEAVEQAYRLGAQRCMTSVRSAIRSVFPEFEDIYLEYQPKLNLIIRHQGQSVPFLQLSQSNRIWIGLIGDLVRRLCLLNPKSLYPCLEGEGIVLIDEIDLLLDATHLHSILSRLRRTFPRVQFIVTSLDTHVLESEQPINCLQLRDQSIYALPLNQYQEQLKQIYQEPVISGNEEIPSESALPSEPRYNPQDILALVQSLTAQDQEQLLEHLLKQQQHPKEN